MRAIFLGKKPSSAAALIHLIECGVTVTAVVAPPHEREAHWDPKLTDIATEFGIPLATEEELYAGIENPRLVRRPELKNFTKDIDVVFSFLFWNKIKKTLIDLPKKGVINFHPAPLPELRGVGGYNLALFERMKTYGVSAHYVAETIDTGDIIAVKRFPIDETLGTVYALEKRSQDELLVLFKKVVDDMLTGKKLTRVRQGAGRYFSKRDFEALREVHDTDDADTVRRKIRAFWYPPYTGAGMRVGGEEFTLVDESILKDTSSLLHRPSGNLVHKGFLDEKAYAAAVSGLTLKYVDILVVRKRKNGTESYILGQRKENPGRGYIWPMGGRSKHHMPYSARAAELISEDLGIKPDMKKIAHIGTARLFWKNSRFESRKGGITTDGDISIFVAEISEKQKVQTGRCFTEIHELDATEAKKQNAYVKFLLECYRYHKTHKTPYPIAKEFRF